MPRPRIRRKIRFCAKTNYFKPAGIRIHELEEICITKDELEALRLKDCEELDQNSAAEKMEISQPTFHRTILSARKKISEALVKGKAIRIEK
ncbi:DUF134 domain-containing protein [archaeon]|jgi:uncharacterized protein|nr:DUF134 domain-containing protein [archaeon]MBT3450342.1 DUF134 domain-containing protein [archaeon]MBT6868883.1 DUF134 domain-containing protein [archaeon]MBT7192896.1 DUF134 domain-containing protein [archaeon]MBT7380862.1 DUF134 domain-containing protein [archaeon]